MGKKLLSLCMALALCLSLLPATALAADGATVYVGSVALTGSKEKPAYAKTDDSGNVSQDGATADDYNIKWDGETLTLQNAAIKQAKEYSDKSNEKIAVYLASGNMNLVLVGENTVDALGEGSAASCGINLGVGNLTISGQENASLSVLAGPTTNGNSCGIYASSTITIESGTVNATGESASGDSYGIYPAQSFTVNGGSITAQSGEAGGNSCGIYASNSVTIEDGSLNAASGKAGWNSCGIYASNSVTIEDGTVKATGGNAFRNSYGIYANSFTMNGGTVVATGGEADNRYSMGVRADGGITITDGVVTATSDTAHEFSYGMNTSGNFTMNGGIVTATSGEAQLSFGIRGGILTINSGTVTATAGNAVRTGTYSYSFGLCAQDNIIINSGTVTATAGNAGSGTINCSSGFFAYDNLTISGGDVTGIGGTGELSCGIGCNDILTIEGGTVVGKGGPLAGANIQYSGGINGMGEVKISGGTVTGTGGDTEAGDSFGICTGDTTSYNVVTVSIKNATVTATGGTAKNGDSSGISATNTKAYVKVTIEDATVTATGGSAGTGSYGILAETTGTDKSADVTINGNSVVRADMTGTEGDDGKPISSQTNTKENGIIFENGEGTVYGDVTLREDLTIAAGETLTIPQDAALTIPTDVTLTNNGRIHNNGNLQVKGEITGNSVTGSGTIQGSGQWPGKPEPVPIPPTYAVTAPETTGGTVTVSPSRASSGRTVTITATPDLGYELESLTVLDSRGNEIALTDKSDGKYTFTMPASRVTVEASFAPAPLPFEDVAPGAWYESAVRYAYFHNIMEGMSKTEFAPTTALTRAMAVQILYNLEGQPDLSDENLGYPYEDVDAQAWYGNAVYWARITGVATGYGDGTFQPTDSITRQEFAQMLYNYAKYKGYDLTAAGDLSQFPDSGSVADWAETAMSWANGNKLINGHDDGTIDAAGIGTRAQAASILMKFDQNLAEN